MNNYFSYSSDKIYAHFSHDESPRKEDFFLHTHSRCELYSFLGGRGTFKVEGSTYGLEVGDILIMRPGEAHYVDIDLTTPYTRVAVHFDTDLFDSIDSERELLVPFLSREAGKLNLYKPTDFKTKLASNCVRNICNVTENRMLSIASGLMPLLNEIRIAFSTLEINSTEESLVRRIISYINGRLSEALTLDMIAGEFYISKPQLCRIFKSETGSGVWEYVTAKRLVLADTQIRAGQSPTKIYSECGFGDYSSFYRAYKKRFGKSPTGE